MDLYVVIPSSKAPIPRGSAGLFRAISHSLQLTLRPLAGPVSATTISGRGARSTPTAG